MAGKAYNLTETMSNANANVKDTYKGERHCYTRIAKLKDIEDAGGCLTLSVKKQPIVLFSYNSRIYALDNRCPHMGFPLSQGTLKDGIITCHWHHARFDLHNGGTFDQWAGDVISYPVQIRNNSEVWIEMPRSVQDDSSSSSTTTSTITFKDDEMMLDVGLKRNIPLIIAKAIIRLSSSYSSLSLPSNHDSCKLSLENNISTDGLIYAFRKGLEFGTKYKQSGWGVGLTIHTSMMNIATLYLDESDKLHALYHGLSAVAQDCASMPPKFIVTPLPRPWPDLITLKRWFRQFVESRNATAAERCLVTAIHAEADQVQLADMLFAAVTDHRFIDGGHILDFTNKALEALDLVGWNDKEIVTLVLTSLVSGYADAERMEESSSWRYPVDLVVILEDAFKELPNILDEGRVRRRKREKASMILQMKKNEHDDDGDDDNLIKILLGDDAPLIVNALLNALRHGISEKELAGMVAYAAALRIAQFHTRNEFTDWDAALHTFTFANAVHQGIRRISTSINHQSRSQYSTSIHSSELTRGIFDAAMRVYLNRFLNIPPAPIPNPNTNSGSANIEKQNTIEEKLSTLLDRQQQVNIAAQLVAEYYSNLLISNNSSESQQQQQKQDHFIALIGRLLLREDRSFHLIQMVEAAFKQYSLLNSTLSSVYMHNIKGYHFILAAIRYLAAHSPTMRSQTHTYQTANQLSLGQNLFE
jgi:nitrite reductase/ring-hydroxylating ferredoxin subunit